MILTILYWAVISVMFLNCVLLLIASVSEKFKEKYNVSRPMLAFWIQISIIYFLTH